MPTPSRSARVSSIRGALLLLVAFALASCYTIGGLRVPQVVRTGDRSTTLGLWMRDSEFFHAEGAGDLAIGVLVLLLYPLELVLDVEAACSATFDETREVRGGALGVVGGILLPWITLRPYLMAWDPAKYPLAAIDLDPADYDRLLESIHNGDGLATFRELASEHSRMTEVYAVEVIASPAPTPIEPPTREGAKQ